MQLLCMWSGNLRLDRLQRTFCKGRFIGPGTPVTSCQGAMQSYYIKQVLINFSVSFSTDPINDRTMLPFSLQLTCANIWLIFKHLNLHIQIITSLILTLPSSLRTLQDEKKTQTSMSLIALRPMANRNLICIVNFVVALWHNFNTRCHVYLRSQSR